MIFCRILLLLIAFPLSAYSRDLTIIHDPIQGSPQGGEYIDRGQLGLECSDGAWSDRWIIPDDGSTEHLFTIPDDVTHGQCEFWAIDRFENPSGRAVAEFDGIPPGTPGGMKIRITLTIEVQP